jgi:hypothetical protein
MYQSEPLLTEMKWNASFFEALGSDTVIYPKGYVDGQNRYVPGYASTMLLEYF